MEVTIVQTEKPESCSIMEQSKRSCEMMNDKNTKGCCQDKETTCVYFCCSQLVAPLLNLTNIEFIAPRSVLSYNSYRQLQWNNPYISAPLRPPDTV